MSDERGADRVLVAGIGNVFLGDDAFGVEVVGRVDRSSLPPNVDVEDYGIRGVHLAYELLDGRYGTLVMIDAVPMGEAPGSLAVLEVEREGRSGASVGSPQTEADPEAGPAFETSTVDAHALHPQAVLDALHGLGGHVGRVLVVGCEPASIEERMGLSETVAGAVDQAVRVVTQVATEESEWLTAAAAVRSGVA